MMELLHTYNMQESLPIFMDLEELLANAKYPEAAGTYYWRKKELGMTTCYLFVSDVAERKSREHLFAVTNALGNLRAYLDYGIVRPPVPIPEKARPTD